MRTIKIIRNKLQLIRDLRNLDTLSYKAQVLSQKDTLKARQLQGSLYLLRGYVNPEDLDSRGCIIHDPYQHHSTYFGVFDPKNPGVLLASARFIHPTSEQGLRSLQLHIDDFGLAKKRRLLSDNPARYAEFSALVKRPGARTVTYFCLLREMLQFSFRRGIDVWLFSMNQGSNQIITSYFGPLLEKIKENSRSGDFNAICTTYMLNVHVALERLQRPTRGSLAFLVGKNTIARFFARATKYARRQKPNNDLKNSTPHTLGI